MFLNFVKSNNNTGNLISAEAKTRRLTLKLDPRLGEGTGVKIKPEPLSRVKNRS